MADEQPADTDGDHGDDGASTEPFAGDEGEYFRWHAATWTNMADGYTATADHLETMFSAHDEVLRAMEAMGAPSASGLFHTIRAIAVRARLAAQLNAAMALAYDDMITAGGPDNEEAMAAYRASAEWCASLQPQGPLTDHEA